MIKYNLNNINDWNFGEDNIIKVYRNNAVCYYKVTSGDTPVQEPCFAVVDNISQYSETEFEDVFNKADDKWYKLNNLNQYEQYGIYGSGRTITTYDGKLTVDEEASPSRLPDGYTEVEYIENTSTSYINTDLQIYSSTTNSFEVEAKLIAAKHDSQTYQNVFSCMSEDGEPYQGFTYRYQSSSLVGTSIPNGQNTFTIVNNEDSTQTVTVASSSSQRTYTHTYPLTLFCGLNSSRSPFRWTNSKFYYCKIKINDELVRDLVPCKRDSDNKYGMYDIVNDVFYVSPNNVDFSGGEPVIQPTKTYEYMYSGGSWINLGEVTGSTATLPDVPFSVNYNANEYNSSTKTLLKTSGQLVNTDAVITAGTPTVHDGYLTIASGTRATIEGYSTYFNRTNSTPNLTIVSKQRTDGSNCHMFANRDSNYNWMYRPYSNYLTLHGGSETGSIAVTTQPVIESVRVDSSRVVKYNNYTNNTTSSSSSFSYGSTNSGKFAIFQGYGTTTGENFVGDFYWVYMSQTTLTDEQVQQVIAYNEGGGGQTEYPLEYVVREDPPNNLVFSSMTEAEDYECPWVGMKATIDGDNYVFSGDSTSGYEWVYQASRLPVGYTEVEYISNPNMALIDTNYKPNQDTRILCEMQAEASTTWGKYFGAGAYNTQYSILLDYENGATGTLHLSWGTATGWTVNSSVVGDYSKHTYDWNKNSVYRDSSIVGSFTYSNWQSTFNLCIFGNSNTSGYETTQEHYLKGKMYSCKIYDNGTLIRDLVPCINPSNVVGAYDIVNDVFYSSARSGYVFTAGPTV